MLYVSPRAGAGGTQGNPRIYNIIGDPESEDSDLEFGVADTNFGVNIRIVLVNHSRTIQGGV